MINLFKKPLNTSIHKDYKKLIEYVDTLEGRKLFKFKELADMPHGRYNFCTRFSTEINMRMDAETSKDIDEEIYTYFMLDKPGIKDKKKAMELIRTRIQMSEMLISGEASYRLASCVYFWETEDLTDYDYAIGDEKIEIFKRNNFDNFFFTEPMKNFLPQMDISARDLKVFSSQERELKKLLRKVLTEKTEENAKATS
jgi:hypothetical protein